MTDGAASSGQSSGIPPVTLPFRPCLMASGLTDKSVTKDDWVDLAPTSEQVYHPILQATTNSQLCSGGTNAEDQDSHSSSWDLWGIVQKPLNWIYPSGGTNSADQKEDSVDSAASTNKYAMAASDQKKPWILEKAGGAVKGGKTRIQSKRGDPDDSRAHLGWDEVLQVHVSRSIQLHCKLIILRAMLEFHSASWFVLL